MENTVSKALFYLFLIRCNFEKGSPNSTWSLCKYGLLLYFVALFDNGEFFCNPLFLPLLNKQPLFRFFAAFKSFAEKMTYLWIKSSLKHRLIQKECSKVLFHCILNTFLSKIAPKPLRLSPNDFLNISFLEKKVFDRENVM